MAHQSHIEELFLEHDGVIRFERFMEEALYHPRYGYYSSNIATVGRRGDFSTSVTVSDVIARAACVWALKEKKDVLQAGVSRRWNVIEVGAGDGSFARDFIAQTPVIHRALLSYHIVEKSEPLKRKQMEIVPKSKVKWHEQIGDALEASEGNALIIANELADAFPARRMRYNATEKQWEELYLRDMGHEGLTEIFKPVGGDLQAIESSITNDWDPDVLLLEDGQLAEVLTSYHQWLQSWASKLQRGSFLTIDYGDTFPQLYSKRLNGTMRGYFQGVCVQDTEIYDRFGHQDLTVDVNFTDLENWGNKLGFSTESLQKQREFLASMLPELEQPGPAQQDPAVEFLMSPYGAGEAFKVLWQRKNVTS
jgi:SAM-dependent MidA family methyltransferase